VLNIQRSIQRSRGSSERGPIDRPIRPINDINAKQMEEAILAYSDLIIQHDPAGGAIGSAIDSSGGSSGASFPKPSQQPLQSPPQPQAPAQPHEPAQHSFGISTRLPPTTGGGGTRSATAKNFLECGGLELPITAPVDHPQRLINAVHAVLART